MDYGNYGSRSDYSYGSSPVLTHYTDASNIDPTGYCRDGAGIDTGISYGIAPETRIHYDVYYVRDDGSLLFGQGAVHVVSYGYQRSPSTNFGIDIGAWVVTSSGGVYGDGISVDYSYGRIIAVHGRRQLHQRLVSLPFRCCRLRLLSQQPCQRFLRTFHQT